MDFELEELPALSGGRTSIYFIKLRDPAAEAQAYQSYDARIIAEGKKELQCLNLIV